MIDVRIFFIIISVTFITIQLIACADNKGEFYLVNMTSEDIVHASIKVCGQEVQMKNISPDEKKLGTYKVKSDSHYTIKVEFKSGKVLQKKLGYVTNGLSYWHIITVTDSNIELEPRTKQPQLNEQSGIRGNNRGQTEAYWI